jgi:major membrane immunogen (membrane-anchored lipoprotein)
MLKKLLSLAVLALLLVACGNQSESNEKAAGAKALAKLDTSTPQGALMANLNAMKHNDLKALMQANMTPEEYERAKAEWAKNKAKFSEADKARFAATMQMLTSEGAEDQIMAMVEPQLQQVQAMLPMMLMMANEEMIDQKISAAPIPDDQKDSAKAVALAVVEWAKQADLGSPEKARKAVAVVVGTARDLGIKSLDEVEKLSFEEALAKGGQVLGGTKGALKVYGIDLDGMLDSVTIKDVKQNGDSADVVVAFEFLGKPLEQKMKMVRKNGRWISAPEQPVALPQDQPQTVPDSQP